jgi:porin
MNHLSKNALVAAALTLCGACAELKSQGIVPVPDYPGARSEGRSNYLTGDWGGRRTALAEDGVQFGLEFAQLGQSVVEGGRREESAYGGRSKLTVNFDLDRMGVLKGALFQIRGESRFGESVNRAAGTILPVADLMFFPLTDPQDDEVPLTVTTAQYTQFLSEELALFVGKFTLLGADANEFAGGDGTQQFLGHSFTSASVTSLFNPYSTVGGGVLYMPSKSLSITNTIYASEDSSTTTGLDTLEGGLVWSGALAGQYVAGDLPGGWRANYQHAFNRRFADLDGRLITPNGVALPSTDDSWCFFANAWQYLSVEEEASEPILTNDGRADLRGIGAFLRVGFADRDTNPIEFIVSGGLGGRGAFGRPEDTWGVGVCHTRTSDLPFDGLAQRRIADSTLRFEAYYGLAISAASILTFDVQWADPLLARQSEATVVGVRWLMRF